MQRDLDALMDWGSTWGMKFNAKKCNIMRVSSSRKPLQHFYSLGNEVLQEVSDAKYLGIQIDWRQCGNSLALCYFAVVIELPDSLWMHCKSEFGVIFLRCSPR